MMTQPHAPAAPSPEIEIVTDSLGRLAASLRRPADDSDDRHLVQALGRALFAAQRAAEPDRFTGYRFAEDSCRLFAAPTGDRLHAFAEPPLQAGDRIVLRARLAAGGADGPQSSGAVLGEIEEIVCRAATASASEAGTAGGADEPTRSAPALVALRPSRDEAEDADLSVAERRRRQIFEGACDVIARKGYGAASMREIAKAAGVTIPTMYQYVKSKEDILFMITRDCMSELFQAFRANLVQEGSARDKLSHAIADYLRYISKNHKYINLTYRETRALSEENREKIFQIEREFTDLWRDMIRQGQIDGLFVEVDPDLAASLIYFFCTVWALRYWAIGHWSEETVRDTLTQLVLDGLTRAAA